MSEDPNARMREAIDRDVVGATIESFFMGGRKVRIQLSSDVVCTFTVVEDFEMVKGGWRFVPNRNPGRPRWKNKPPADGESEKTA